MANETIILGNNNWAVKANNLLGYAVGETSGDYVPREFTFSRGSTATYIDSNGLIQTAASNIARVQNSRLLLEPQRTNLILRSNEFSTSPWSNVNSSFTANTTISPEGINNAGTAILNAVSDARIQQGGRSISNNTTYTFSCYFKNISLTSGQTFNLRVNNALASPNDFLAVAVVDLFNQTVTASISGSAGTGYSGSASASIINVGNGWLRVSLTFTVGSSGATANALFQPMQTTLAVSRSCYIYGCQIEVGSNASSYIPTITTTETRLADNTSFGVTNIISQTEGTLFANINFDIITGEYRRVIALSNNTTDTRILIVINSTGRFEAYITNATVNQFVFSGNVASTALVGQNKVALAYIQNDVVFYLNGVQIASTTTATIPTTTTLYIGKIETAGTTGVVNGYLKEALYYPKRLTNSELEQLTKL